MIPVLSVTDPVAACRQLAHHFGFRETAPGRMAFGPTRIAVVRRDTVPEGLIDVPLDHVAFQVPVVETFLDAAMSAGAVLDPDFTPQGPREIPEFWDHGVRFVFFEGPDAAPFEFCTRIGSDAPQPDGHGHLAIRTGDLDRAEARIAALGGRRIAQHRLTGDPRPVTVRFLQCGPVMFELFDEAPYARIDMRKRWIGLLPDGTGPM